MFLSQSIRLSGARVAYAVSGSAVFPPTFLNHRIMMNNSKRAFQTFPGSFVRVIARKRGTTKNPAVSFGTSSRFFENEHVLQSDKYSGSGAMPKIKERKKRRKMHDLS